MSGATKIKSMGAFLTRCLGKYLETPKEGDPSYDLNS